jgi:hypothetical protein
MMLGPNDILHAARGVLEERVAAIDDDVAGFEIREQLLDEFVHRLACLDHEHHPARTLEQFHHLLNGVGADDLRPLRFVGEEFFHLRDGAVVSDDGETVVVHVEDQVLAHDGQPDEGDISLWFHSTGCR